MNYAPTTLRTNPRNPYLPSLCNRDSWKRWRAHVGLHEVASGSATRGVLCDKTPGRGGQLSDSSQVYVRTLKYCKLTARLGAPGLRGTCFLGSFYLVASEMFVNGIDSSGSSQMLLHGDAQSFPYKVFHGIHEPIRFITNIKSMAI